MKDVKNHERINDILLGPLERPALQWLAAHLPKWVTPDVLTGIGIIGSLVSFFGYWFTRYDHNFLWLASLGFIINWFGDSLDGTVARYRNIQRPRYGFFIDHNVDIFTQVAVFLGLGLSSYVRFEIATLALVCYLILSILVYVKMLVTGVFQISYGKLGPTEARVIGILANAAIYFLGNPSFNTMAGVFTLFDIIGVGVCLLLLGIYLFNVIKDGHLLSEQDNEERLKKIARQAAKQELKLKKRASRRRLKNTQEPQPAWSQINKLAPKN